MRKSNTLNIVFISVLLQDKHCLSKIWPMWLYYLWHPRWLPKIKLCYIYFANAYFLKLDYWVVTTRHYCASGPKMWGKMAVLMLYIQFIILKYKPQHDKTNKMSVHPPKIQISLGISPVWSEFTLCAQWVAKEPRFLHADSEDWSDWADAQADLSLRWMHSHIVGFVMKWLILFCTRFWFSSANLLLLGYKKLGVQFPNFLLVFNNFIGLMGPVCFPSHTVVWFSACACLIFGIAVWCLLFFSCLTSWVESENWLYQLLIIAFSQML